jgi:short-subunit dehydrogenase
MNYLIFGASRGLGALFNYELPKAGDKVWLVSRTQPDLFNQDGVTRFWIQADLSLSGVSSRIAQNLNAEILDVCLYNAGIWEEYAFTERYNYEEVSDAETERLIAVNLTSAITCVQKVLPNLRRSVNPKIIFTGSGSGLENSRQPEIANTASKFGLRGVTHALREVVRKDCIGVTCLNLGDVGVITYQNGEMQLEPTESGITPADLVAMLKYIINLSSASCVKEIDLFAMSNAL